MTREEAIAILEDEAYVLYEDDSPLMMKNIGRLVVFMLMHVIQWKTKL